MFTSYILPSNQTHDSSGRCLRPNPALPPTHRRYIPSHASTAASKSFPFARFAAIALESVQPVPWVLGLSCAFRGTKMLPFHHKQVIRIIHAVSALAKHPHNGYALLMISAAVTISAGLVIFISASTSASGMFGVTTVARAEAFPSAQKPHPR